MRKTAKRYEIDMTHGPLAGKMLLFIFPLMATTALQLIFNAADMVVVGQYSPNGAHSIAAIGSTLPLINLVISLIMGCATGTNVAVAESVGAAKDKQVEEAVHTSIAFSLLMGLIFGIIGILISGKALQMMHSPEELLTLSKLYVGIYFAGLPILSLYNFGSGILRAIGDTRRPMIYLLIAGILNVALNLVFVIVFDMDVMGVALATVISQAVSALLVLISLMRSDASYRFSFSKLKITPRVLKKILYVGLPAGFQSALFNISNVLIQSSINSFGVAVIAGNSAASNIGNFVNVVSVAIVHSATSFSSQNYGARKFKRIDRVLALSLMIGGGLALLAGGAATLFGRPLLSLYTKDPDAIDAGMIRLYFIVLPQFLGIIMNAPTAVLRGIGLQILPMLATLIGACGFRIVWIYTIFAAHPTLEVLYACYPVTWTITAVFLFICYFAVRRRWKKKGLLADT